MSIPIPAEVFEGIEAVRLSGVTNMLDRPRVSEIAEEVEGLANLPRWLGSAPSAE